MLAAFGKVLKERGNELGKKLAALKSEPKGNGKVPENKCLAYFEIDYFYPQKGKKKKELKKTLIPHISDII